MKWDLDGISKRGLFWLVVWNAHWWESVQEEASVHFRQSKPKTMISGFQLFWNILKCIMRHFGELVLWHFWPFCLLYGQVEASEPMRISSQTVNITNILKNSFNNCFNQSSLKITKVNLSVTLPWSTKSINNDYNGCEKNVHGFFHFSQATSPIWRNLPKAAVSGKCSNFTFSSLPIKMNRFINLPCITPYTNRCGS